MSQAEQEETPVDVPKVRKRSIGFGPLSAILFVLLTYFGSQILAGVFIGLGAGLFGLTTEDALEKLESSTVVQFGYILLVGVISLVALWLFMRMRSISWKEIGLGRGVKQRDIGPAFVVFVIYFLTLIAVTMIVEALVPSLNVDQKQQLGFEKAAAEGRLALVFVSLVIMPAIVEEIMVRGFLYSGLRKKLTKIAAAIVASVIFGIAHLQIGLGAEPLWIAAIDTTILSLFLIYLREKTGALWAGMMVHGLKNGLAFIALFVVGI
jgi:membrane protease YdiL (CAAX protease family)